MKTTATAMTSNMTSTRHRSGLLLLIALAALVALSACDDDGAARDDDTTADTSADTPEDTAEDTADTAPPDDTTDASDASDADSDTDAVTPAPVEAVFDLDAMLEDKSGFFQLPWPSDARLTGSGGTDIAALGNPARAPLFEGLLEVAHDHRAFPTLPVGWFRFTGAVAPRVETELLPAAVDSPVLLVDVDPDSPDLGTLYPTVARTLVSDPFVPDHVLAVAPRPGFVLAPERTYAFVVRTRLGAADGTDLAVAAPFAALAAGSTPPGRHGAAVAASLAPLWPVLDQLGVPRAEVAAATVFTTGDESADNFALTEAVRASHSVTLDDLAVVATWDRYCQLAGTMTVPEFQEGTPPFRSEGGVFVFDAQGALVEQRTTTLPVTLTIPRREMPAEGFPLMLYFHGSGGVSTECVDRGPRLVAGGPETPGEGPAHVVAEHGIAMACTALPVNPERVPGAIEQEYIQVGNPRMMRDTFRQGILEQRLFLDALLELELTPAQLAGCDGATLPAGATRFTFRQDGIAAQGQSMGGMYTNLVAAVEPRIEAVVPTGAAGFWSYFITVTTLLDAVPALELLLGARELTFLHPALHTLQLALQHADPVASMPRLARRPLPDHPVRSIYEPVGRDDRYFPTVLYDAVALAYGHPQAGELVWPSMQEALALQGLDGLRDYPVTLNLVSERSAIPYTGVVVQYEGDGIDDPHAIYVQRPEVRYQYGCFLETWFADGVAVVPAPAPLGTPCPHGP